MRNRQTFHAEISAELVLKCVSVLYGRGLCSFRKRSIFAGRGVNGGGSAGRVVSVAAGRVILIILISLINRIDGAENYKNYKNYTSYTNYTIYTNYGSLWVGGAAGESAGGVFFGTL